MVNIVKIGIIGGSGLDNPDILENAEQKGVDTLYGKAYLTIGKIKDTDVVLVARHGKEHTITPTNVNFRANIQALKDSGCTHIIATTAVDSYDTRRCSDTTININIKDQTTKWIVTPINQHLENCKNNNKYYEWTIENPDWV